MRTELTLTTNTRLRGSVTRIRRTATRVSSLVHATGPRLSSPEAIFDHTFLNCLSFVLPALESLCFWYPFVSGFPCDKFCTELFIFFAARRFGMNNNNYKLNPQK